MHVLERIDRSATLFSLAVTMPIRVRDDSSALQQHLRLGMTVGQLLACASALLSGEKELPEGDGVCEKELTKILLDDNLSSTNFFSVFEESDVGQNSVIVAIAGLDVDCQPLPAPKRKSYKECLAKWQSFTTEAVDIMASGASSGSPGSG